MSITTPHPVLLNALLPSAGYILSYSLPLLLISAVLTFAGAFLTLDRTRSFPPRYNVIPGAFDTKAKRLHCLLQGGVGGLAIGYAFGVHLSTFLTLLIPSISSSASLGPKEFIAVWLLSAIITTFLAGRWQYAALAFSGISGGGTLALSLSVIIHPSLTTRIILTGIFLPIVALLTILPLPKIQHVAFRLSTSATGAFGLVVSIALLSQMDSWANVWERFWKRDGETWGSGKEKGLSAAWCLFMTVGVGTDWLLKRRFGENPDEKWDHYLANYAANLPNYANRAGTFQPLSNSFWDSVFGCQKRPGNDVMSFPSDNDMKAGLTSTGSALTNLQPPKPSRPFNFQSSPEFLKKGQSQSQAHLQAARRRERVKFGKVYSDSSDSDSDDVKSPPAPSTSENARPWLKGKTSMSSNLSGSVTLNGADDAKKSGGSVPEHSDHEEDVTAHAERIKRRVSRDGPSWSPDFLTKHRIGASSSHRSISSPAPPGAAPVPATPSLIKAIERVAIAHRVAFNAQGHEPKTNPDSNSTWSNGARWEEFWRDVRLKAGQL